LIFGPSGFGSRNQVLDLLFLQGIEQLGIGVTAIEPNADGCLGESISQQIENPSEDSDGAQGCGSISWPEDDREQVLLALVVELQRSDDRQVAPRVVMAVALLLVPVSGSSVGSRSMVILRALPLSRSA